MFKRLIATLLAGTMALTSMPLDSAFTGLRDMVLEATEGEVGENAETNSVSSEAVEDFHENAGAEIASEDDEMSEEIASSGEESDVEASEDQSVSVEDDDTESVSEDENASEDEEVSEDTGASDEESASEGAEISEDTEASEEENASENEEPSDISEEESAEEATEEQAAPERIASFTQAVDGVDTYGVDFSSCELMIGTEDPTILTWDTEVLSEYRGVYLTRYTSVEETRNAYTYYYGRAEFVSANITFRVADTEDVHESEESEGCIAEADSR